MSSYFATIRRLKDSHHYIQEITRQFALYKATQDQVDSPTYKTYNRATTNRLICKEQAAKPIKKPASQYIPTIPEEPGPPDPGPGGGGPTPTGTTTVMINFDQELKDRSNNKNDALFEFTNNQLQFADGKGDTFSFAVNFNQNSNSTYDKLWIPFSNSTQLVYDTPNGFSILMVIKPHTLTNLGTATSAPQPAPKTSRIKYFGGPVLNKYNVQIYNIWWGSSWNSGTAQSRRNTLIPRINTIVNSDHYAAMWQYQGIKKPASPVTNIVWTGTSVPSGPNLTFCDIVQVIQDCKEAGAVPNYDANGELFPPGSQYSSFQIDYKHLYFVILPLGRYLPPGYGGASSAGYTNQCGGGTAGTVYMMWSAINPPESGDPRFPQFNLYQMWEQAWAHEVFHHMESAMATGGCTEEWRGWTGTGYSVGSECNGSQHASPGCGVRNRTLSGTDVLTESYWSDMDGGCVAPGSGDNWTREPAATTGTTIRRYLFQKLDDLDNGATAAEGDDGTIYFNVKKAGIEYKRKTSPGVIRVNEWADVWFTFDNPTNTPKIYVNDTEYTTPSTEPLLWNNKHSHFIIGNYDLGAATGQYRGLLDELRLYRNKAVTALQVDTFEANGISITPMPTDADHGVFVVNRFKIDSKLANTGIAVMDDVEPGDVPSAGVPGSFTSASFTTTSFTI